jgi:hypothetical protein
LGDTLEAALVGDELTGPLWWGDVDEEAAVIGLPKEGQEVLGAALLSEKVVGVEVVVQC